MKLYSTKHNSPEVDLKQAVIQGLPADNGLFMPNAISKLPEEFFDRLPELSIQEIGTEVANHLFEGYIPPNDVKRIVENSITFDAPLVELEDELFVLELFQGPTLAFKDFGARFMGRLMEYFLRNNDEPVTILVATSGDTGSAVAHGFLDVEGINVVILYPKGKVSDIQEKQFTTLGKNITALEIDGTFDDCQALVKQAFLDQELNEHMNLSSANSINIARLIPQSFYYFNAYRQLPKNDIPTTFCVPSGNFGNLTAGLFAKRMGLPIDHFVAATNANDIFVNYIKSGNFDPKASVATISNAMDVGNPSNFFRILDLYNNDLKTIREDISAYSFDDVTTARAIKIILNKYHYLMCPHTAVGFLGIESYRREHQHQHNAIVLSTAHPVKFGNVIEPLIEQEVEIPSRLQELIKGEKLSVPMTTDYNSFKAYLMQ